MKKTIQLLGAVALTVAVGGAQAIPLSQLIDDDPETSDSITVGDKLFDSWSVGFYDSTDVTRALDPDKIAVNAIDDGGDYGLAFTVANDELKVTGDDDYAYVDLTLSFRASVAPGTGMLIDDVSLLLTGGFVTNEGDNGIYVYEMVGTAVGLDDLGDMDVEFSWLDQSLGGLGLFNDTSDSTEFAPQPSVWITKNILVWATASTESAGLSSFEQRFSQTPVPVPAPLALLALGLLGIGWSRRRH